jgi:ketosteroid isomerase-like protein
MTHPNRQLVEDFFKAVAAGHVPDDLVTPDLTFWSVNSGMSDKTRFLGGIKILASIFAEDTLTYFIDSLTAQEDRLVAEIRSQGTLINGEPLTNTHVFLFQLREGRIAAAREYMNQFVVREKIVPLMQAAMAKSQT